MQPILILTDHKALESWKSELLDTPSGPIRRRLRWHQLFSKFDISVGYIPGKENTIADILSRWAYPASQAYREISKHGTLEEKLEMEEMIRQEKCEEAECLEIRQAQPPSQVRPVREGNLLFLSTFARWIRMQPDPSQKVLCSRNLWNLGDRCIMRLGG